MQYRPFGKLDWQVNDSHLLSVRNNYSNQEGENLTSDDDGAGGGGGGSFGTLGGRGAQSQFGSGVDPGLLNPDTDLVPLVGGCAGGEGGEGHGNGGEGPGGEPGGPGPDNEELLHTPARPHGRFDPCQERPRWVRSPGAFIMRCIS